MCVCEREREGGVLERKKERKKERESVYMLERVCVWEREKVLQRLLEREGVCEY